MFRKKKICRCQEQLPVGGENTGHVHTPLYLLNKHAFLYLEEILNISKLYLYVI